MNNSITFQKELLGVQDDLLRFAYKLTSDHEEANDLLQETSLKALDNEDKYAPDTNFKGWMYTIMRNIFINNYRIVNALPREYKIPFSMHVSGFKYREIAEKLGLPLGTVKSRIFFTRQKLQQELKDFV